MVTLKFKAFSVRKIDNPNTDDFSSFGEDAKNFRYYVVLASIFDIPEELGEWRDINPRDPNVETAVPRAIRKTLEGPESYKAFFLRNRWMTVLAEDFVFDNQSGDVELIFTDKEKHGLLDWGHTFEVIKQYVKENSSWNNSYVKLEIFTQGDLIDSVTEITWGRNRSTNVSDIALVALDGKLDGIREILWDKSYFHDIAWKPNETYDNGEDKKINLLDILAYLECFDVFNYPSYEKNPIFVYSTKWNVAKKFENSEYCEKIAKIEHLLPDILELRDWIIRDIPELWKGEDSKSWFWSLKEVKDAKGKTTPLPFIGDVSKSYVTSAYYYPVLSAFRALIKENEGTYTWRYDLKSFYDRVIKKLVHDVKDRRKNVDNVNQLGKDNTLWTACFKTARMELFEIQQEEHKI